MTITEILQEQNAKNPMLPKINLWRGVNKIKGFHSSAFTFEEKRITSNKITYDFAYSVSKEIAGFIGVERVKVSLNTKDEALNDIIENVFSENNFWYCLNNSVEDSRIAGTAGIVVSSVDNETIIDFIKAENIFVLRERNGIIKDVLFVAINGADLYIQIHKETLNGYDITSYKYVTKDIFDGLVSINSANYELDKTFGVNGISQVISETKRFAIIKPAGENYLGYGYADFHASVDILKTIDVITTSIFNECHFGKRKILVDSKILDRDPQTNVEINNYLQSDILMHFDSGDSEKTKPVSTIDFSIRADDHIKMFKTAVDSYYNAIGFGSSYTEAKSYATATQVISDNSQLHKFIMRQRNIVESAVKDIVVAILSINKTTIDKTDINVDMDDSIVEDKQAIQTRAMTEFNAGIITDIEYRMIVFGEEEKDAIKQVQKFAKIKQEIDASKMKAYQDTLMAGVPNTQVGGDTENLKQAGVPNTQNNLGGEPNTQKGK